MGTAEVLEGAPKVLGGAGQDILANIEALGKIDKIQKQLGGEILEALTDEGSDEYDRALAHACLNEVHGRVTVVRSPRDVLAALEVFETAVADPADMVLHVTRPGVLSWGVTNLHGQATRTVSATEKLRVAVSGNPGFPCSAQEVHDGFFNAEEVRKRSHLASNPLLIGCDSVRSYLEGLTSEIAERHITTTRQMSKNGVVHEVADIHGQLTRHGFDAAKLDPEFVDVLEVNQAQARELGGVLLKDAFAQSVWERPHIDASESRELVEARLLDRIVFTAKILGITQEESIALTEADTRSSSEEVARRHEILREKVVTAMQ